MTERLLTPAEAGSMLAMSKGALAQLRYLGRGPRFVKLGGRSVRYREEDLDEWIRSSLRTSTAPAR